ncbi:hypothetical protein KFE25_013306 [Diacronema lutheri]|uniref:Glutamine amidotransferase domain-containing protein n=1 Tax=Diacronema lutheri TaxID=2081491 RepID=A0A8J5XN79_DIALT|nr:hypothetical protein KFE25_013306 [Diacronema lutheri]
MPTAVAKLAAGVSLAAALGAAVALRLSIRRRASLRRRMRVAFIHAEDAPKWSEQLGLYMAAFDRSGEFQWREYRAWLGELPRLEEADAAFISGSHHNVTDAATVPWMQDLFAFVRAAALSERVRLVGICFGCQAVAAALGGTVGPNQSGAFAYGVERLWPAPDFAGHPAVASARTGMRSEPSLAGGQPHAPAPRVLESHGQCVHTLPPGATLLASSASAAHELFAVGPRVLCMQFHPEMSVALLEEKIAPALLAARLLSADEHREAVRTFAREYDAAWASDASFARALVSAHIRL